MFIVTTLVVVYEKHQGQIVTQRRLDVGLENVNEVYDGKVFSLGSTNTTLIRDEGKNIIFDPGILQLGRYGTFQKRLAEFDLTPDDIDIVINSHCHYDHIESNYLF